MKEAIMYYADGRSEPVNPQNGTDFTLNELKSYVEGYIEIIRLNDNKIMIVNEEGKIEQLEVNHAATRVVFENGILDQIVGNALVCSIELVK